MKINNNYKFYSTPFPHLVFENFLDNDQTKKIVQEISEISNLYSVKKVMGGRFQYQTYHFDKKSLSIDLFDFFNNYDFFNKLNNLLLNQGNENKEFIYDNKFEKIKKKKVYS